MSPEALNRLILASGCFSGVSVAGWVVDPAVLGPLVLGLLLYALGLARLWHAAGVGHGTSRLQAACFAAGWLLMASALIGDDPDRAQRTLPVEEGRWHDGEIVKHRAEAPGGSHVACAPRLLARRIVVGEPYLVEPVRLGCAAREVGKSGERLQRRAPIAAAGVRREGWRRRLGREGSAEPERRVVERLAGG